MLQGGASTQFSAVPLNLTAPGDTIDHVITGSWSKKAYAEAERYCTAHLAAKVCLSVFDTISGKIYRW
jgi:phosphoserine aminotransferase